MFFSLLCSCAGVTNIWLQRFKNEPPGAVNEGRHLASQTAARFGIIEPLGVGRGGFLLINPKYFTLAPDRVSTEADGSTYGARELVNGGSNVHGNLWQVNEAEKRRSKRKCY